MEVCPCQVSQKYVFNTRENMQLMNEYMTMSECTVCVTDV